VGRVIDYSSMPCSANRRMRGSDTRKGGCSGGRSIFRSRGIVPRRRRKAKRSVIGGRGDRLPEQVRDT
jgi:hypothetical protein